VLLSICSKRRAEAPVESALLTVGPARIGRYDGFRKTFEIDRSPAFVAGRAKPN
jgi:hypothetical protein